MRALTLIIALRTAFVLALLGMLAITHARAATNCPGAVLMLPMAKAYDPTATIVTGARLAIYIKVAEHWTGFDLSGSPRAILIRRPNADVLSFEDPYGCLLPFDVRVPRTELI